MGDYGSRSPRQLHYQAYRKQECRVGAGEYAICRKTPKTVNKLSAGNNLQPGGFGLVIVFSQENEALFDCTLIAA